MNNSIKTMEELESFVVKSNDLHERMRKIALLYLSIITNKRTNNHYVNKVDIDSPYLFSFEIEVFHSGTSDYDTYHLPTNLLFMTEDEAYDELEKIFADRLREEAEYAAKKAEATKAAEREAELKRIQKFIEDNPGIFEELTVNKLKT